MRHVLLVGDSLAFYGPVRGENSTHPQLYPNVLGAALTETCGAPVAVDVVARTGWTARDAWWALTRDPLVYSVLLPRADAVVLAVGNMDYLPTAVPTWLREGIRYLRPPGLRRGVRAAYAWLQRHTAMVTPWRALPQRLTDQYLAHCVGGIRYYHPDVPVVGVLPPPHRAPTYGGRPRNHAHAVEAARAWGEREAVPMVDLGHLVAPHLQAGRANPDGMHFGWESHRAVGEALAVAIAHAWRALPEGSLGVGPALSETTRSLGVEPALPGGSLDAGPALSETTRSLGVEPALPGGSLDAGPALSETTRSLGVEPALDA